MLGSTRSFVRLQTNGTILHDVHIRREAHWEKLPALLAGSVCWVGSVAMPRIGLKPGFRPFQAAGVVLYCEN